MPEAVRQYIPELAEYLDATESNFTRWTSRVALYATATSNKDILLSPAPSEPVEPVQVLSPSDDPAEVSQLKESMDRYKADLVSYRSWEQRNAAFLLMIQSRIKGGTAAGIFERHEVLSTAYAEFLLSHANSNNHSHHIALAELPHLKLNGISPVDIMDYIRRVEERVRIIRDCELEIDDSFLAVLLTMEIGSKLPHLRRDFLDKEDLSFTRLLQLLRSQASTTAYDMNDSAPAKRQSGAVANLLITTNSAISAAATISAAKKPGRPRRPKFGATLHPKYSNVTNDNGEEICAYCAVTMGRGVKTYHKGEDCTTQHAVGFQNAGVLPPIEVNSTIVESHQFDEEVIGITAFSAVVGIMTKRVLSIQRRRINLGAPSLTPTIDSMDFRGDVARSKLDGEPPTPPSRSLINFIA